MELSRCHKFCEVTQRSYPNKYILHLFLLCLQDQHLHNFFTLCQKVQNTPTLPNEMEAKNMLKVGIDGHNDINFVNSQQFTH